MHNRAHVITRIPTSVWQKYVHFDGVSLEPRISFAVFENLRLYIIFLNENKSTSFLEVFAEFSSHRGEKSRQFQRIAVEKFTVHKIKHDRKSSTSQTELYDCRLKYAVDVSSPSIFSVPRQHRLLRVRIVVSPRNGTITRITQ